MKPMYLATLVIVAAFGLARADNPPASTTNPASPGATTTAAGAPATPAAPPAHTPAKALPPWKMYMRNGEPKYCREVPISSSGGNSRITETKCVNETDYIREQEATARTREALQQGSHGCQPNCGH